MVKHMISGVGRMGKVWSEWNGYAGGEVVVCGMWKKDGLSTSWEVVGTVDISQRRKCRSVPTRLKNLPLGK